MLITSSSNLRIKNIVRLRKSVDRKKNTITIVEGPREIANALDAKLSFKEAFISQDYRDNGDDQKLIQRFKKLKLPVYECASSVFSKIAYGQRKEGILALCKTPQNSLSKLLVGTNALFVVVENVEKPGNLGAILRSCDGAGAQGLIVCQEKTDLYNPNVIRASLGTVFTVPTATASPKDTLDFLRKNYIQICATSPKAKVLYSDADFKNSLAIIVGSEQKGLGDFWIKNADITVKIPMKGKADSLNVSSSTAILLYEALRQKKS